MTLTAPAPALLVLEDGSVFEGEMVAPGTRFGEVVFNTSMTGYQEILTDPSYRGQLVVLTQPHQGNYGVHDAFDESRQPWAEGLIARQVTPTPARGEALTPWLRRHRLPAIAGIDTRALVRRLRVQGALRGVVTSERSEVEALVREVKDFPSMEGRALVDEVTAGAERILEPEGPPRCAVAVYDFGVKENILRCLRARGARVHVLPARTPAQRCQELGVHGVVLSNGPGDPAALPDLVGTVKELAHGELPVLGICLGHQLLGLALGAKTFKLKFGHHGGNQPVRDEATGKVTITSQNHGFAVDAATLPEGCRVSEINLNDGTLEAFEVADRPIYSAQYHPEAAPGPRDASPLFDRFLATTVAQAQG
ncbi:MAG: glutamine-hydrolyzing carbamoyl-phosphate synthase small subunit [Acidobacteriota bacterium]